MQTRNLALMTGSALLMLLATAGLLPGTATARQDPTPTPAPLGDFIIPTSTPVTDPLAPTPAPGGITIPTSTPRTPADPALTVLPADSLIALNLQPGDVPAEFAAGHIVQAFDTADMIAELSAPDVAETAALVQHAADTYGWTTSQSAAFVACLPNLPISEITSEIAQLNSPEAARAFFDDPRVQELFGMFGYTLEPAGTLHGWRLTLPRAGVCVAEETQYSLMFDYWGLYVSVAMTADAATDPDLVWGLLDQLAALIVARIDALVEQPFPPTPTSGAVILLPPTQSAVTVIEPTEALTDQPTMEVMTAVVTMTPAIPEPAFLPSPTPFIFGATATPVAAAATSVLADLEALMPTLQEIGLPSPPFSLNEELSGTFDRQQVIDVAESTGVAALAQAVSEAATRDALIGEVMRVWDTGDTCPATPALSLEVDLALFESAEGAARNLGDEAIQQAWLDTGVFQEFASQPDGSVLAQGRFAHPCGQVSFYARSTAHGRSTITVAAIAIEGALEEDILTALDVLTGYMVARLAESGVE